VTFSAEGYDATGQRLPGSSLAWFDTYIGVVDQPLGSGNSITITLMFRPEDAQVGGVTEHSIRVDATDTDGRRASDLRTAYARAAIL
jgi:hypothetical protein